MKQLATLIILMSTGENRPYHTKTREEIRYDNEYLRIHLRHRPYGPDLSAIGAQRGAAYIKQALLEPSARVPDAHVVVTAKPKDARSVRGVRVNEDVFWVYVRDPGGRIHRSWKSDLEALEREAGASLMPAYGPQRSATEVHDLVAYLAGLRGQR